MRTLRKNQVLLQYSLQVAEIPEFQTDADGNIMYDGYTDDEGNFFPYLDENGNKTPLFTGTTEILYGHPNPFMVSISMSGGEAEAVEYGLSTADYSAVIILPLNAVPLKEGALIWHTSEPAYKYGGDEINIDINGEQITGRFVEKTSADYIVVSVRNSLNYTKIILDAVNK